MEGTPPMSSYEDETGVKLIIINDQWKSMVFKNEVLFYPTHTNVNTFNYKVVQQKKNNWK